MENRCNYFENNFGECYHLKLLELSDGTLKTEDGFSFLIHKFTLAKKSQYFFVLFCGMEKARKDILIPDIKGEDLSNILSYLYTGIVHVTNENICDLIVASDYLLLDDLLTKLKHQLRQNLTLSNSVSIYKISLCINQDDISRECFRFIQTHFESLVLCENSQLSELPLEDLKLLLGNRNLCVTSENTVWLSIITWIEGNTFSRLPLVPDLLIHLAISDIDESLADEILQHDIVAKNAWCHEIYRIKSLIPESNNLETLQHYLQHRPMLSHCEHRQPTRLNLIAHYSTHNGTKGIQVYLTYDENIDLWRKLFEIDSHPEVLVFLNDCIYMFGAHENRNLRYNIIEKLWNDLADFRVPRYDYEVVTLDGLIYILGGISENTEEETREVEIYNSETDEWNVTTPMLPVTSFTAVAYNNVIYVVGYKSSALGYEMVAQAYEPYFRTWTLLPPPSTTRLDFTMVVYRDMIYVIGGFDGDSYLKDVEVFDPFKNEWSIEEDLPYAYYLPEALILNDKLIVYGDPRDPLGYFKIIPSVSWNIHLKRWETLENSFMKNLYKYYFLTIDNTECINIIALENKGSSTHFENSPFS